MHHYDKRLLRLIRTQCLKRGEFTLASGAKSDYFIDLKRIAVNSKGANLIGKVLYRHTKDLPFEAIGGMQVGAIPLVTSTVMRYHRRGKFREGFWVRPEVKDHGTQQMVEGIITHRGDMVVVEDVTTTGQSVMKVVEAVWEKHGTVVRVVSLVDRMQGARELFEKNGLDFRPVFTIEQVLAKGLKKFTADNTPV